MALHTFQVLRRPLITEKSTILQDEQNKYGFEVDPRANKEQVRQAVEAAFNVHVVTVNMATVKGKMKRFGPKLVRRPSWKKAVVSLKAGDKIQIFEGA
ncbi:MAG: 50S ribosomal protein L23 [Chloroflexi bacterium]|nr:50S ribosomal protein L23 [Chloroflexota bacterium]